MNIQPIKNEEDYQKALQRLEEIFDAKPGTKEGDELEVLGILIDHYEQQHDSIDMPDPIEAIRFRMDQLGLEQKDLADLLGYKSRVSEILNKRRKLNLQMIRTLQKELDISAEVLVRDYQ